MSTNVYSVNGNNVKKLYKKIPYEELLAVLRKEGSVFLQHPDKNKFKRQTIHRATRVLTERLGKKVVYCEAIMSVVDKDIDGFILEVRE